MKRITYSFLLILLMSCGASHPMNYIEMQIGLQPPHNYFLTMAGDSSIGVMRLDSVVDGGETFPLHDVGHLFIQRNTTAYGWIGGLTATAVATGAALALSPHKGQGDGLEASVGLCFFPLGAFIGCKAADGMREIDTRTPEGIQFLKDRATTKEE